MDREAGHGDSGDASCQGRRGVAWLCLGTVWLGQVTVERRQAWSGRRRPGRPGLGRVVRPAEVCRGQDCRGHGQAGLAWMCGSARHVVGWLVGLGRVMAWQQWHGWLDLAGMAGPGETRPVCRERRAWAWQVDGMAGVVKAW